MLREKRKKKNIVMIEKCNDCRFLGRSGTERFCCSNGNTFETNEPSILIPDWCYILNKQRKVCEKYGFKFDKECKKGRLKSEN